MTLKWITHSVIYLKRLKSYPKGLMSVTKGWNLTQRADIRLKGLNFISMD
jgi:hypothetical protein